MDHIAAIPVFQLDACAPAQIAMRVREVGVTKATMPVPSMFPLAVWLCMGARSIMEKILAILLPISAFVACGFGRSVANMFFLPIGIVPAVGGPAPGLVPGAWSNLAPVTIGYILGGGSWWPWPIGLSLFARKERSIRQAFGNGVPSKGGALWRLK